MSLLRSAICLAAILMIAQTSQSAIVLINDQFNDGGVGDGADPLDIAWTNSNVSTLSVAADAVIGGGNALSVTATSSFNRIWGAYPTGVTLAPGETLTLSFDYRFTQAPSNTSGSFRFGLYNNGGTETGETDNFGYAVSTNPGSNSSTTTVNSETAGNSMLGGASPNGLSILGTAGQSFNSPTTGFQSAVFSIFRTLDGNSLELSASINGGTAATATHNTPLTFTFHGIVFGQGGVQHNYALDNILLTVESIPEPTSWLSLGLAGSFLGLAYRRSRHGK